ncbi:MOSC domain-containing protein [Maritimibacter sp. DP1N21-5]|uniref:MOSC domain-containing protein n=1 Tax=Maritimibacter sp. DP1N21-5 TaxID=2836867 RepID=UPI001C4438D9|nr:MOSC domain-containing protein [Maritimibacter sp. DP1N21-5]MBV7410227.1 MOSC domain-containing protein [Maritimibacter sp. DP1N21-5]
MSEYYEKTPYAGRITFLGAVTDRDEKLASDPAPAVEVTFAGIAGESHAGLTRPSCSRVKVLHPRDTEIRNVRQISILSEEELDRIAAAMGLDRLDPSWIGASMVLEGIPDFSHLPTGSRLQARDGTTLVVEMINHPCTLAGRSVETFAPGFGPKFKPAAEGLRGITAWVEREGRLSVGDSLALWVPTQRAWVPGNA